MAIRIKARDGKEYREDEVVKIDGKFVAKSDLTDEEKSRLRDQYGEEGFNRFMKEGFTEPGDASDSRVAFKKPGAEDGATAAHAAVADDGLEEKTVVELREIADKIMEENPTVTIAYAGLNKRNLIDAIRGVTPEPGEPRNPDGSPHVVAEGAQTPEEAGEDN